MTEPNNGGTPPADTEAGKTPGPGRPSKAELEARASAIAEREQRLKDREAALAQREEGIAEIEKQAQLDAAEANLLLRETEAANAERAANARAEQAANARAGAALRPSPRQGEVRSEVRDDLVVEARWERKFKGDIVLNQYDIPPGSIPHGMSYQWNNYTVLGAEDVHYNNSMAAQGWRPVPASRHPELVPEGVTSGHIVIGGQILVERPQELTNEARRYELDKARNEVAAKEAQLYGTPPGTMQRERANGTNDFNKVRREVEQGVPITPNYTYDNSGGGLPIDS